MGQWMNGFTKRLDTIRKASIEGGGVDRIEIQHKLGKLTVRERIERLFDPGSFQQLGTLVVEQQEIVAVDAAEIKRKGLSGKESPSDGVMIGFGKVNGKKVAVYATDFTVMSGSIGDQGSWMIADMISMAGKMRIPIIALYDSAGLRGTFTDGRPGYDGIGRIFKYHSLYSGVIPQIGLLLGPCVGLMAYAPVLCHFLIMNEKTAFLWLGGERKSDIAGSAQQHMMDSGQCDFVVDSDEAAIDKAKELLRFLPQNCWKKPARFETSDPIDRQEEELLDVMPNDPKFTYDIHEIIKRIVDDGYYLELKEDYANHFVIGFCSFGGRVAGLVANNPDELSGIFEPDCSDKYDRFMNFLDAFSIPLITLSDTTAFVPGDAWERKGVIRHGAKLLHSYARFTAPKVSIPLRRFYGGGQVVMGAHGMAPDLIYGWPTAEFAPAGPENIVQTIFHKELKRAKEEGNYQEVHDTLLAKLVEEFTVMTRARSWTDLYIVQEVIDPRETRPTICKALEALEDKEEKLPENKRSIKPA